MKSDLTARRAAELGKFCTDVGIKFSSIELLDQAFHHRSCSNEHPGMKNNERLEFLGDSVLGMVTASYLYRRLGSPEGELAKIKSAVVSEKALAPVALRLGIDRLLVLGHGEEMTGGRRKPAILADCMEAVIGAYYLDSGYHDAETYVLSFIRDEVETVLNGGMKDYKTRLQEFYQKESRAFPVYELVGRSGPDHNQTFRVVVHLGDRTFGPAEGRNKKDAEQNAARMAMDSLSG